MMRNVTRGAKPGSLQRNAGMWTRELLAARRRRNLDPKRLRVLFDRYKCADVRDALDKMYSGLCCYCEAEIGVVAFDHIEHRKPKRQFPRYCFDWRNLHLGCPKCNQAKGEQWVRRNPILDSVADVPIENHLTYDVRDVLGVVRCATTARGRTTVDHADLDRDKLRDARTKVALGVLGVIAELNHAPNSPRVLQFRLELEEKTKGPFGSLVRWLRETYLKAV